jgi:hypothetical protein
MDTLKITKGVVGLATGLGASAITKTIIDAHCAPETTLQKVLFFVGRFGIGGLVGAVVTKHTESEIDSIAASWRKMKQLSQETETEVAN